MENVNHQVLDLVPQKHLQIVDPSGGCFTWSIKHQRLPDKVEEVKEGGAEDVSLSPHRCRELQPGADWGFAHRTHNTQHILLMQIQSCTARVVSVALFYRSGAGGLQVCSLHEAASLHLGRRWKLLPSDTGRNPPTVTLSVSVYNIMISPAECQSNNCVAASSYRNKVFIAHCCWILLHCAESWLITMTHCSESQLKWQNEA